MKGQKTKMSNSDRLRETIGNNPIGSEASKEEEAKLKDVVKKVFKDLKTLLPERDFVLKTQLKNKELLDIKNNVFTELGCLEDGKPIKTVSDNMKTSIRPDGGIIFMKIAGAERIVLVSEAKIQGTNIKRIAEGKKPQSLGNAIERASKNIMQIQQCMKLEDILPYVLFASGCDLGEGSYIIERVRCFVWNMGINKEYVDNIQTNTGESLQRISLFAREERWTYDEMYEILISVAIKSISHYTHKYELIRAAL